MSAIETPEQFVERFADETEIGDGLHAVFEDLVRARDEQIRDELRAEANRLATQSEDKTIHIESRVRLDVRARTLREFAARIGGPGR